MVRWTEQYKEHPIFLSLTQIEEAIKNTDFNGADLDAPIEVARFTKVLEFLKTILNSTDVDLLLKTTLDNMHSYIEAAKVELANFSANKNLGHLHNLNSYADHILGQIIAVPNAGRHKTEAFTKANEAYSKSVNTYLKQVKDFADNFKNEIDNTSNNLKNKFGEFDAKLQSQKEENNLLRSEFSNLKQTIESEISVFRQNVETEQASLRQGIETEQATLRKGTEVEQTALRQKLEELSTSFQTKHIELQEKRSKEFTDKIQTLQILTDKRIAEEIQASEVIMATLEKYEQQAKQVLGTVISTSQAGVYKLDAAEEGRAARFFRAWASAFIIFAVLILIGPVLADILMKGVPNTTVDWHDWISRLPISVILFAPAFYFARESSRHRNSERKSKRLEHILSTIDPYLELLDGQRQDNLKNDLKAKLAEKIFDPNENKASEGDDIPVSAIAGLIAAIRGKN